MADQQNKKRRRGAGDQPDATIPPRRSKRLATRRSQMTGVEALPPEILDGILGEVALGGDARRAVKDLTAVEKVSKGFQKILRDSPTGEYRQSLNEAGEAAKRNYEMLPRRNFREGGPVPVDEYVGMVGPGIHLLPSREQSTVVEKVRAIRSDWRRADALNKIASFTDGLDDHNNRSLLLDSAIDLIEQPGPHAFHACKAVAKMYDHRTEAQEQRIAEVRNRDPLAAATIDDELDAIGRQENTSTVENTPSPSAGGASNGYIPVRERVRNAAEDLRAKVDEAQTARVKLINTMRPRDGRG